MTSTKNPTAAAFMQYLKRRGYHREHHGLAFTNSLGDVCVVFRFEKPNLDHFTAIEEIEPRTWQARIGLKDFTNKAITGGLFDFPAF